MRAFFMVFILCAVIPGASAFSAEAIRALDCDGRNTQINAEGAVTVVIYSNEDVQDKTREVGRAFDDFQGIKAFREIVVVDMRGSLGSVFKDITHSQMRHNLDSEAKRLTPFYLKNGNKENPRKDLVVIADFDGKVSEKLGWKEYDDENVSLLVYDQQGLLVKRWDRTLQLQISKDLVKKLLETKK